MRGLENRIPPPLVATLFGALMWLCAQPTLGQELLLSWRSAVALVVLLVGVVVCLAGVQSFRAARTKVNPLRPDRASSLVSSGIYRVTRNPMYLGFAIVLVAWSILLAAPLTLLGVAGFVLYMNRFQIAPEERALAQLFGDEFSGYQARTRRWL
ncbi:MAG: methyltransferase family protein [Pseudomonas sp.]|uniref:methyltransferase family protein n=1 Tax=Pseudomonas sp. TaxID=306 RepID=UPI003D0D1BFB